MLLPGSFSTSAITDFFITDRSYGRLASILNTPPRLRRVMDFWDENYMKIILIYLFNSAKYKAGKYQMAQTPANTFCKFVKQFSFTKEAVSLTLVSLDSIYQKISEYSIRCKKSTLRALQCVATGGFCTKS